jgi:hypothetical protein
MNTKIKDEKIEGHIVTFSVSNEGTWYATAAVVEGASTGKTIVEAQQKMTTRLRRATVNLNIKAHLVNAVAPSERDKTWYSRDDTKKANHLYAITLTGIAQRDGDIMYRFEDSKENHKKHPHQGNSDPESIGVVCRCLTVPEQNEYKTLRHAFDTSRDALAAWITDHKIADVAAFVEKKIAAAIDTPNEDAEIDDPRDAPLRDQRKDKKKRA